MAVVYAIDCGVRNAVGFAFNKDSGWLYQNAVSIQLIKKHGKENIFYWMSSTKEEVDFVVKVGRKVKRLIQVCYDLGGQDTKKREIKALLKASKELKCKDLLVITEDYEAEDKVNGNKVKCLPLWKWLLLAQSKI